MASTQYNVIMNDQVVETKSSKPSAVSFADALATENPTETVQVVTGAGTVVHEVAPSQGTKGHFKPWTRVEVSDKVEVDVPAGFTVAYVRSRVNAVVARANDKSGWVVITPSATFEASNTKEAREITNQLAADRVVAEAARKEQEATAKAEAKAARDAQRAEAKAQKEADKAAKAEAKAAEKDAELVDA